MKDAWDIIRTSLAAVGGVIGWFLGGCDGLILTLVALAIIDYITGVMCAIAEQHLSSATGFKGIAKKVLIFLLVGVAHVLDVNIIGRGAVLRTATIFFYISNEGISIIENAVILGLPVPQKLIKVLEQIKKESEDDDEKL